MSFLHPEFLWLAPLVAVPILIHLLNRVRYRRMRWAAMEFLLATEQRAVRRARLRQILLMILRTAVLLFALGALAQPILSGTLASLLGNASQVVVALDASASMSAADASGSAFERAKRLAAAEVAALPRGTRAAAFAFAARTDGAFRVPIQDHRAVASAITSAELTGGATDIPLAIRTAAESLRRGGGGGTIWLLTDLRDAGWHAGRHVDSPAASGKGAWDDVRAALQAAGHPRIVITDAAPAIASNTAVAKVQVTPDVLLEGDVPRLTAAISLEGGSGKTVKASLSFDGRLVDTRTVQFTGPGAAEAVFHLPALTSGPHAGYVELEHDALPADDRSYFVLRPAQSIPVLIASGQVSSIPFESSGDFLAAALEPPTSEDAARSPFTVKAVPAAQLAGLPLADFAAVCLADVARPDGETLKALRDYLAAGGLVIIFPGPHTDTAAWNASGLVDLRLESTLQAEGEKHVKVNWTSPTSPVTATLAAEGLDRLAIARWLRLAPAPADEVLARLDAGPSASLAVEAGPSASLAVEAGPSASLAVEAGEPFLIRSQVGKGKIYVFAVSCQNDFSNLPFTPILLIAVHRMLHAHLVETGEPLFLPAFTALEFPARPGDSRVVTPGGKTLPVAVREGQPSQAYFEQTAQVGIYRLASGDLEAGAGGAPPLAAINTPVEESSLARIPPDEVRTLLGGSSVYFLAGDGNVGTVAADSPPSRAATGFPLAALALAFILGEVLLAWSMSRPAAGSAKT